MENAFEKRKKWSDVTEAIWGILSAVEVAILAAVIILTAIVTISTAGKVKSLEERVAILETELEAERAYNNLLVEASTSPAAVVDNHPERPPDPVHYSDGTEVPEEDFPNSDITKNPTHE